MKFDLKFLNAVIDDYYKNIGNLAPETKIAISQFIASVALTLDDFEEMTDEELSVFEKRIKPLVIDAGLRKE